MRAVSLLAAIAIAAVLVPRQSQAQVTVDLPLPPPADRMQVLGGLGDDPSGDEKLLHYLLDFDLCTLTKPDGSQLVTVTGTDGAEFSPVFATMGRVREVYGSDAMPECATGRVMLGFMRGKRVVFDPTGPHSVAWSPEEVRRILKAGKVPEEVALDFDTPDTLPSELVRRLTRLFQDIDEIESAWLTVARPPGREQPVWRLEVHADQDVDRAALDAKLRRFLDAWETPDLTMQVFVFPDLGLPGQGRQIYAR